MFVVADYDDDDDDDGNNDYDDDVTMSALIQYNC